VDGLHLAVTGDYAVIVLDVMLPGMDGWSVLRELRKAKDTPVIFLTARDEVEDRVKGLELGADDYLIKALRLFRTARTVAHPVAARSERQSEVLAIADLELDPVRRRVGRGCRPDRSHGQGIRIAASADAASGRGAVAYLHRRAGMGHELRQRHHVVEVAIRRLRAKMDDPFHRKLLHTMRGMGYVLEERE